MDIIFFVALDIKEESYSKICSLIQDIFTSILRNILLRINVLIGTIVPNNYFILFI